MKMNIYFIFVDVVQWSSYHLPSTSLTTSGKLAHSYFKNLIYLCLNLSFRNWAT